jgi:WD40 repeat protein
MKETKPLPIFAAGHGTAERVQTHPRKQEAITSDQPAILVRWTLDHDLRVHTEMQTPHVRLNTVAVSPDGEIVAVAPLDEHLEFRRWDDLSLLPDVQCPISEEITSLAFSPDGRWLALANRHETIYIIDRTNASVTAEIEGGERTSALLFSPTSPILASACSFQGGGHVRIDRIDQEGRVFPVYELDRSDFSTLPGAFVDSLVDLAFSPDGRWLALFESSAIYHSQRPPGWRGNIVLYSLETGMLQWQTSLDAQVTGDKRSLEQIGCPLGFFTELLFANETDIACGASRGLVMFYDVITGKLKRGIDLHIDASVLSLSLDKDGALLWGVLSNGKLVLIPL